MPSVDPHALVESRAARLVCESIGFDDVLLRVSWEELCIIVALRFASYGDIGRDDARAIVEHYADQLMGALCSTQNVFEVL